MGKKHNQSKKAKQEFLRTSVFAIFMGGNPKKVYTRDELSETFGMSDRSVRERVAELANYLPVISLSNSSGYKILCFDESTPKEELVKMREEIDHQVNEFKSRIANLNARMKPLIALKSVIDKKLAK